MISSRNTPSFLFGSRCCPGNSWSICHNAIKEFFKQCFEYFRITAVHCFGKRGFFHGFHTEVIKTFVVGKQSVFNFTQRILAGNLSKEQSQKLFPCGEMLAISVSA